MREVKVLVGPGLDQEGIKDVLNVSDSDGNENMLLFDIAHALLTEHQDDRAEIHSVDVEEVTIAQCQGTLGRRWAGADSEDKCVTAVGLNESIRCR